MKPRTKYLTGLILILISTHSVFAEVIHMRNGRSFIGQVVSQTRDTVTIRVDGETTVYDKDDIIRIVHGRAAENEFRENQAREEQNRREAEERRRREEAERQRREEEQRRQRELEEQRQLDEQRRLEEEQQAIDDEQRRLERERQQTPGENTLTGILTRQAILPGWGSYRMGQTYWGATHLTANIAAIGFVIYSQNQAASARSRNESDVITNTLLTATGEGLPADTRLFSNYLLNDAAYQPYDQAVQQFNTSLYVLAGTYLFSLGHSYLSARSLIPGQGTSISFSGYVGPSFTQSSLSALGHSSAGIPGTGLVDQRLIQERYLEHSAIEYHSGQRLSNRSTSELRTDLQMSIKF